MMVKMVLKERWLLTFFELTHEYGFLSRACPLAGLKWIQNRYFAKDVFMIDACFM